MLKPKNKGLFVDISEYAVLAARTSGFKLPFVVEEIQEFPLKGAETADDIRAFIEGIVDFKGAGYYITRCGVYPGGRFTRFFEAETINKAKDIAYLSDVLKDEFDVKVDACNVSILNAKDGSDYDPENAPSKKVVFCGAPHESFEKSQAYLLECGLYPERLELSSVTSLGGVCDYARYRQLKGPTLFLELTSEHASIFIQRDGQVEVARPLPFGLDSMFPLLQRELGLKDEQSARKLFFSNTFDFAEMGSKLLRRVTKELQATVGFYEVQTGQTLECLVIGVLPKNLSWITKAISDALGLEILQFDFEGWLKGLNVEIAEDVEVASLGARWLGVFSMMGEYQLRQEAVNG